MSSRAQIVLWYNEGHRKGEIAAMSGATRPTVDKWLKRWEDFGIGGLVSRTSRVGRGRSRTGYAPELSCVDQNQPTLGIRISHWTSPEMARYIKQTRVCMCRRPGCRGCGENMA